MRILLYLLLVVPLVARAGTDPSAQAHAWLQKMIHAVKNLNYEGSFVYIHGDQLEAMRIVHARDANGEHERLLSLNGVAREILRDNDLLTCILPDSHAVMVERSSRPKYVPDGLLKLNKELNRYYSFELLGQERMTGRASQIIGITARDRYRYSYKLWLDRKTGILLKSDLLNENGMPVEQMMFTNLRVMNRIPAADLQPAISGKDYKWYRQEAPAKAPDKQQRRWQVGRLPPGFFMSMHLEHGMPDSRMPVDHMMFTDGLSTVSVYIEAPDPHEKPFMGTSHMGAVNAYGSVVNGHQITVVGEVPRATVTLIGKSVHYEQNPGHAGAQ